jgi:site-specific recombinase XerD
MQAVDEAIEAMLAELDVNRHTKRSYRTGLNAFLRYLGGNDAALSVIEENTLAGFAQWLREHYPDPRALPGDESQSSPSAHVYLCGARRLMSWLDIHFLLPDGVTYDRMARRAELARGRRRLGYPQKRVDPDILLVLSHYLKKELPEDGVSRLVLLRDRALVALLYDTAARISEALALTRGDVMDGRTKKIRLTRTKTGKPRIVFLNDDTRALIAEYVKERGRRCSYDNAHAPLFVSHGRQGRSVGGRLAAITQSTAWTIVKQAAIAEGLYENTSPHCLRHRRAQDLLDAGMPLHLVQAYLGHESPSTTRTIYAWETDEHQLAAAVDTYGERATVRAETLFRTR